jgi:hypothetical protein
VPELPLTRVAGYRRSCRRNQRRTNYSAQAARSGSDKLSASDPPLLRRSCRFRPSYSVAALNNFHEISRAAGPRWTNLNVRFS